MKSSDSTAVSDCLLYEFPATTKVFAQMLAAVAGEVGKIVSAKK